ncbi:MAG: rhomboid family intramembrane serine protease [Bacteroidales bacterium]|jgi:membrane associated rhomboid family serine protease|nr:rhomboid family intramembrane serine protease [Bacteroidales bacterium]MCK9498201.1 rhomboid family intramembrane serine protease [Bacteroidales bacterium]MDY0313628.1 rhomboid family intramembrane serine protease [Bacteroidales bacterium]NLB87134.1 rhomboid family intramembrane serine protease [Bacteroidales bacterium]
MSFFNEVKYSFKAKNNFNILIYINLIVFVLIQLLKVFYFLNAKTNHDFIYYFSVPANLNNLKTFPWTIITYMFTHESFLHILFNLLAFYWFGKLFLQYLSQKQLLGVYILGGLLGGLFYILAFNTFPIFNQIKNISVALGASASVMAVIFSIAMLSPNQEVRLAFLGKIKLKHIALVVVIIDIMSIPTDNSGGHIAHLGGAAFGLMFAIFYKKNIDITVFITRIIYGIKNLFTPKKGIRIKYKNPKTKSTRPKSDWEYNARKKAEQEEINKILEKISKSGYEALTTSEKEKLFKQSR